MRILACSVLACAGFAFSLPAEAQVTTRIETRPVYGATVTLEHGVRVYRPLLAEQIYQFTRHNSCFSRATIAYPQTCTVVVWCRMRSSIAAVIQCAINVIYKPPPAAANACCAQQG